MLEEIVVREHGEDTWDDLLDAARVEGAYTSLGSYPDPDFAALIDAASRTLALAPGEVVRWYGRNALPLLADRYPEFFAPHGEVRSFALTLNEIIHPEVRKLYPGADTPMFTYDTSSPDRLLLGYRSPRRMCAFAEGLLLGAADHYRQTLRITQPECMHRGDARCLIAIDFAEGA